MNERISLAFEWVTKFLQNRADSALADLSCFEFTIVVFLGMCIFLYKIINHIPPISTFSMNILAVIYTHTLRANLCSILSDPASTLNYQTGVSRECFHKT